MENQAKFEHLVAAVAHDLKNQLQSLNDQQDKIINELPTEYQQEFAPMLRQTNRIKEDALRLVSLFKLEHQQQFPMDDCWPRDTASDAIESCSIQHPELVFDNRINLEAQGFYNEQLIKLALITLINNSAQAGAHQVEILCEEDNKQGINLIVHDDGPGFSDAILKGDSNTTKPEGTGLGLIFVDMICQAHRSAGKQGTLQLSNSATGAMATLYLP